LGWSQALAFRLPTPVFLSQRDIKSEALAGLIVRFSALMGLIAGSNWFFCVYTPSTECLLRRVFDWRAASNKEIPCLFIGCLVALFRVHGGC